MGAVVGVFGRGDREEVGQRLHRMLSVSEYRGQAYEHVENMFAVGVQSLGWDASLASTGSHVVAFHGYLSNISNLEEEIGIARADEPSLASRLASLLHVGYLRLFERLQGEFAVVLVERASKTVYLGRDGLGLRPLCFGFAEGHWCVGTEPRQVMAGWGVRASVDLEGCMAMLFRHGSEDRTLFANVQQARAGVLTPLEFEGHTGMRPPSSFFALPPARAACPLDEAELAEELRSKLRSAVVASFPSGPVGVELSGGVDSSIIWAFARQERRGDDICALSDVYPGWENDESTYIDAVLSWSGGRGIKFDCRKVIETKDRVAACGGLDWPAFPEAYAVQQRSALQTAIGFPVALSGRGGDEWFTGDLSYLGDLLQARQLGMWLRHVVQLHRLREWQFRDRWFWRAALRPLAPYLRGFLPSRARRAQAFEVDWVAKPLRDLIAAPRSSDGSDGYHYQALMREVSHVRRAFARLAKEQLTSRGGVETRYPFFNHDLLSFVFSLPPGALRLGRRSKELLRQAAGPLLPPLVRNRMSKAVYHQLYLREVNEIGPDCARRRLMRLEDLGLVDPEGLDRLLATVYHYRNYRGTDYMGIQSVNALWGLLELSEILGRRISFGGEGAS